MMYLTLVLDIISAVLAFLAAYYWFKSSRVKTPESFSIHVVKPSYSPMSNPMGGTYMGHGYSGQLQELGDALKTQSKLSAYGAILAGLAAVIQTISTILKLV